MKREGLVILLACMIIFIFPISTISSEYAESSWVTIQPTRSRATLFVGSDQTYKTIGEAVTASNPGDTIRVYSGIYTEKVILDKTLTMIGNGSSNTIIKRSNADVPLQVTGPWCNVSGFSLIGSGNGVTDAGILIDSKFSYIKDCNCSDNLGNGIRIESSGMNNKVENCTIMNNSRNGIRIQTSPNNIIRNCTILLNQENGIYLQGTQGNIIENNSILESKNTGKSSIAMSSVSDNIFKFNYLKNNDHGISIAMGDNNIIIFNTLINTADFAMELGGSSGNNSIHHNNFIGCNKSGPQASDGGPGNTWDNGYPSGGNYWSDWISPDIFSGANQDQPGGDGFVDVPYDLGGGAGTNDSYPLTTPFVVLDIITDDVLIATEDSQYSVIYDVWTNWYQGILLWSLKSNATWLDIDSSTIHGTPNNSQVGSYWVNISVTNGLTTDSHNFTLKVINVNDPPMIITEDVPQAYESQLYSVDYEAVDIDPTNDVLSWSVVTNATFLHMVSTTGVLSGTPTQDDLGTYYVDVLVNDGKDGWNNSNFTLTVFNINDPPEINSSWPDLKFDEDTIDESISLNDWFMDKDKNLLGFSYSGSNNLSVTILPTGFVRLVPKANWSGSESLTFYANDTFYQVSDSINVTVNPVNDAPFDPTIDIIAENKSLTEGYNLTLIGNASDVDLPYGDVLNYKWSSNLTGELGESQEINISPQAGFHKITLNVTDSAGAWVVKSKNIEILPRTEDENDTNGDTNDTNGKNNDTGNGNQTSNGEGNETNGDTNKTDTDNDNLPDDWEVDNFSNLTQNRTDDPDKDGYDNYQEWENETDPNDPNDYPGKTSDGPEEPGENGNGEDDGDSNFWSDSWWILLLILLIIIIILILAIVTRKKKDEKDQDLDEDHKDLEITEEQFLDEALEDEVIESEYEGEDQYHDELYETEDGEELELDHEPGPALVGEQGIDEEETEDSLDVDEESEEIIKEEELTEDELVEDEPVEEENGIEVSEEPVNEEPKAEEPIDEPNDGNSAEVELENLNNEVFDEQISDTKEQSRNSYNSEDS